MAFRAGTEHPVEISPLLLLDGSCLRSRLGELFAARVVGRTIRRTLLAAGCIVLALRSGLLRGASSCVLCGAALASRKRREQEQGYELSAQRLVSLSFG